MEPLLSSLCHYLQTYKRMHQIFSAQILINFFNKSESVIDLKEKFRNSSTNRDVVAAGEKIMEMDYWRFQSLKRYQIQEMC